MYGKVVRTSSMIDSSSCLPKITNQGGHKKELIWLLIFTLFTFERSKIGTPVIRKGNPGPKVQLVAWRLKE